MRVFAQTQSFNTTNSMGRLMLNVLLSFAQFEREVTGERIRDKIAASKAKGMWMGGLPPLGYDIPAPGSRALRVNETEAATVRAIFARYLELGSVHALQRELAEQGVLSKRRVTAAGKATGGKPFSRGALFHLLRNRIYLGQIVHRDVVYPGEHKAILDEELFARAQAMLDANARRHRTAVDHRIARAPLTGKLFDASGEPMTPTFSRGQSGRAYRYYVSASLQQGSTGSEARGIKRLSAPAIERVLNEAVDRWLGRQEHPLLLVRAVRLVDEGLLVELSARGSAELALRLGSGERLLHQARTSISIYLPLALPLRGGQRLVAAGAKRIASLDPTLIAALRKAHRIAARESGMPTVRTAPESPYERKILRLAFLAPDLQRDIIAGLHPPELNLEQFMKSDVPLAWAEQRIALGWAHRTDPVMQIKSPVMAGWAPCYAGINTLFPRITGKREFRQRN